MYVPHFVAGCLQVDVLWRVPQHVTSSGDAGSTHELRGWVQPQSSQDRRAIQAGLEAGRRGAPPGEAAAMLPSIDPPPRASLLVAPGRRGGPPAPSNTGASGSGAPKPADPVD